MYFYMKFKKNSVWYNFYQGTSVSITFYIFEHYQLWMMDSKAQRVFFPKTPKLCVWHTEVRNCSHFKLVSHFHLVNAFETFCFPQCITDMSQVYFSSVNVRKSCKYINFAVRSGLTESNMHFMIAVTVNGLL